jgi:hypothetical protein
LLRISSLIVVDPSNHLLAKDKRFKIILTSGDEGLPVGVVRPKASDVASRTICCINPSLKVVVDWW